MPHAPFRRREIRPCSSSATPAARGVVPRWRTLLPLCVLVMIVAPGCVAANPFFRVTAALWSAMAGTP